MHVLIVEDEPVIARRLQRLTRDLLNDPSLHVETASHLQAAERHLAGDEIDLLFLDLDLHGADGYEVLRQSVAGAFQTIVVSAHTDRALEAFEYGVLDFVGKPFSRARLAQALARVTAREARSVHGTRYLSIRKEGHIALVGVDQVRYVEGAGSYARLVLRDGSSELHDKPLHRLVKILPPVFERIHRSYIARLDELVQFHVREGSRYELELVGGLRLPVGRTRYRALRARLEAGGGEADAIGP